MRLLIFLVVLSATTFLTIDAQQQPCGKLSESYLYNRKKHTALDEYPWLGLLVVRESDGTLSPICSTVLISERYTLIPAHCVAGDLLNSRIIFGDWELDDHIHRGDCSSPSVCAPAPQVFSIQEVLEHPHANNAAITDDIALLKLNRDVVYTDYIQPICLPPAKQAEDGHIGQRLEYAGYPPSEAALIRSKAHAHTTSLEHCKLSYDSKRVALSSNQICGYIIGEADFASGAILMGVNVTDGRPANFYLIAMTNIAKRKNDKIDLDSPMVFTRIWPYRNIILQNMN